ncbi:MAG: SusC/RagA family TonB-linked outer membrane protein, partial [Bacteroidales bacterium]|nr:SusC/RagA family TonB-linked outer membrane protein [Bacteroidales bacterium]
MKKMILLSLILLLPMVMFAQQTITGTVLDEKNAPFPGVNVAVKGTVVGTISDANGKFSIRAANGSTLAFTFVGYRTLEVPVTGAAPVDVSMTLDFVGVDEIVVIGYGTSTKKEVTGSVTSVKADAMVQGNLQTPMGAIQGTVAGLSILRTNGSDPNNEYTIRLRGLNSFSGGKSPLILVDGVVWTQPLSMINPETIESIDVLKDGSAAAIYGTRATNGVILLSLKQPVVGDVKFEISSNVSLESFMKDDRWFSASEYRDLINDKAPDRVSFLDRGSSTDWQEVVFVNPVDQYHSLTISGGSEKFNFLTNMYFKDDQGLIDKNYSRIVTPSIYISQKSLNDRLNIDYTLMYSRTDRSYPNTAAYSGVVSMAIVRNPTEPVYDEESASGYYNRYTSSGTNLEYVNPVAVINERTSDVKDNFLKGAINASFSIVNGLSAKFQGSYNYFQRNSGTYQTRYYPNLGRNGDAVYSMYENYNHTLEPSLEYKNTLLGEHNIQAVAGYSFFENVEFTLNTGNYNFDTDNFLWNNIGAGAALGGGTATLGSSRQSNRLIAFFGRLMYNFKDKYLLSGSLRYEGSSRFGANNKWGLFPALSAGWRINEEAFLRDVDWINNLKLRAGYGVTGNQDIPNYQSIIRMSVGAKFYNNGQWVNTFQAASNPNPDLKWEKKTEYNFGIDLGVFDRISLSADYYTRTTSDMLWYYTVPVPPNVLNNIYANVGSIRNRGVEMQFDADIMKVRTVTWTTSVNYARNRNRCISLSDPSRGYELPFIKITPAATNWAQIIQEGEPVGDFWAPVYIGANESGEALYKDVDGDGTVNTELDREIVGHDYPNFELGWRNSFRYRNFDFSFAFRGMFGQSLINYDRISFENWGPFNAGANVLRSILDRPDYTSVAYVWDSRYVEKSSFIKLGFVTLGYNLKIKGVYN